MVCSAGMGVGFAFHEPVFHSVLPDDSYCKTCGGETVGVGEF